MFYLGQVDCAVGQAADFPSETLFTVISSSGSWYQFPFTNGNEEIAALKEGSDYQTALNGQTWQEYKATSGYKCHASRNGKIDISTR